MTERELRVEYGTEFIEDIIDMTDEERRDFFRDIDDLFCTKCGRAQEVGGAKCRCWDDG